MHYLIQKQEKQIMKNLIMNFMKELLILKAVSIQIMNHLNTNHMKDNAGLEINELNDISMDTNQENSTSSPPYQSFTTISLNSVSNTIHVRCNESEYTDYESSEYVSSEDNTHSEINELNDISMDTNQENSTSSPQ
ncbi:hypothetical protein M9Y10_036523 [Tritrichomonas musculus]|uniref:Uncharacterized protein n=1 Tax=Tritrichomonas musculus TaxID=1915356 RepID=A0ABR2GUA8_9EUKA